MLHELLRKGMVIRFTKDENNLHARNWVVLPVTKKDIKRGINADQIGFFAFGGMWYGRNPMKIKSYGKIQSIDEDFKIIRKDLYGISVDDIQKLVQ